MVSGIIFLPKNNFLSSKQKRTPKIYLQMLKQQTGIYTLRHILHKQTIGQNYGMNNSNQQIIHKM